MKDSPGLKPDAPIETNAQGGQGSKLDCDLYPAPRATLAVGARFAKGRAKYEEYNWKKVTLREHLNHVLNHINGYLAGDRNDDHMAAAGCRMMMALELEREAVDLLEPDSSQEYDRYTTSPIISCYSCHRTVFEPGEMLMLMDGKWLWCKNCRTDSPGGMVIQPSSP